MNIKTNSKTTTTTTSIIAILSIAMITSVISGSINMQSLQQYAKGQMDNGSKAESANEYKNISSATNKCLRKALVKLAPV